MIARVAEAAVRELARGFPIVALTGPRQSGKTTLVRQVFQSRAYASLEDPDQLAFARDDPRRFLEALEGGVIDEAQRCPELFSYLQTIVDQSPRRMGRYVLTGSQQFGLLAGVTQSLAGRVGFLNLLPFSSFELQQAKRCPEDLDTLLFQGLYPPIYDRPVSPGIWHANYNRTYVERDVRQLINVRDLGSFQKFIRLCAASVGQLLNLSALGTECGVSHNTVSSWLSVLEASFLTFRLRPHFKNYRKRLVKTAKVYFYDTGLAAWLIGIREPADLAIHPARGALFESWVIGEAVKAFWNRGLEADVYFWRSHIGHEVDLIVQQGLKSWAVEAKSGQTLASDAFQGLHRYLEMAGEDVSRPILVHGGGQAVRRSAVEVVPWRQWAGQLKEWVG